MSYLVRLRRKNGVVWETAYTFPINPFVSPDLVAEHTDQEPPRIAANLYTWTIEALLRGKTEAEVIAKWDELVAAIEEGDPPVQGVQLVRDGVVVENVSPEGGFYECKIEHLASPKTDTQWETDIAVSMKVTGVKLINTNGDGVTGKVTQTLTYSYDEAGFLTKTLAGQVDAVPGNAESLARALGLTVPGADFAYVTRGPEGVDVEILDQAGKSARFTSIVRQSGQALPSGVGPGFSVETKTTVTDGEEVTTVTASGEGPDVLAAVKARRPSANLVETITNDPFRRTASATWVTKKKATNAPLVKRQRFTVSGGGRPIRWTRRTGGRKPLPHIGSFQEVTLEEEVTVEKLGTPGTKDFKFPAPLVEVRQDLGRTRLDPPQRIELGKDRGADKWSCTLRRFYVAPEYAHAFNAMMNSLFQPGESSALDIEAQRQDEEIQE